MSSSQISLKAHGKPYLGIVDSSGAVNGRCSNASHNWLGFPSAPENHTWRFRPETGIVFWWAAPSEASKEAIAIWLSRKGREVKAHKVMIDDEAIAHAHGRTFDRIEESAQMPRR